MSRPPPEVAAAFDTAPPEVRTRLLNMRALILAAASATGTAPLTETLKWGQPAYLPSRRDGTTIRLGWKQARPDLAQMLVHCQTDLVARWQQLYPEEFHYAGNRAVLVPATGPYPEAALQQMAAMALTYHRDRARRR